MNFEGYGIKDIMHEDDQKDRDIIEYLLNVLNDRSIPEENKALHRQKFNELMKIKNITMKPPKIIIEKIK